MSPSHSQDLKLLVHFATVGNTASACYDFEVYIFAISYSLLLNYTPYLKQHYETLFNLK